MGRRIAQGLIFKIKFVNIKYMAIDWTKIYKKHRGLWVALKDDEKTVVGRGKTAKKAWEEAKDKGYEEPILFRVPTKIIPYVGYF